MAPVLVNSTSAQNSSPTIASTTAGNCLVVCIASGSAAATISSITLGGVAGNFAQLKTVANAGGAQAFIWACPGIAGGQTALVINNSGLLVGIGAGGVMVYEVSGLAATIGALLDQSSTGQATSASWSSGATPTTTQAAEFWAGVASTTGGVSAGPTSPWVNNTFTGSNGIAGEQITTSTGAATYAGTQTSGAWAAAVVTLQGAAATSGEPMNPDGWVRTGFDQNTDMQGSEGISGA